MTSTDIINNFKKFHNISGILLNISERDGKLYVKYNNDFKALSYKRNGENKFYTESTLKKKGFSHELLKALQLPQASRNLIEDFKTERNIINNKLVNFKEKKGILYVKDNDEWKALTHETKGIKKFYSKSYLKRYEKFSAKLLRDLNLAPPLVSRADEVRAGMGLRIF